MAGIVKFNIFRDAVFVFGGTKRYDELNKTIIDFLKLCNDDAEYEINGFDNHGDCVLDMFGSIDRICRILTDRDVS